MIMDVRRIADSMGAKSLEIYPYNRTWSHVCWTGGQLGRTEIIRDRKTTSDGVQYAMCPNCRRFFYAMPKKERQMPIRQKQFAVAYGSR